MLIEEEQGAELVKEGKARYLRAEFEKCSAIFMNILIYKKNPYSLEKLRTADGKVKKYFIHMDCIKYFRKRLVFDNVKIHDFTRE